MQVYIIHGWEGSPKEPMLRWLKSSLEKKSYGVAVPAMPNPGVPKIKAWVGKLAKTVSPDRNTILVGHSIGCQAILRYLQALPPGKKIRGVVLIAPWMKLAEETMEEEGEEVMDIARPWLETPIDFKKIKKRAGRIVAIFSDNDYYVPLDQKAFFKKRLGAKVIMERNKGHFAVRDGTKKLPSALRAIIGF
ncbi:MAG: alpha/beta hydrolase [Candidatus Liptonbacteria bacterium]|nr:alpha/beta hydrolase [Candidatus Liptonbacteria bacterium]